MSLEGSTPRLMLRLAIGANELGPAADARRVARERLELAHSSGAEGYRFEPYRAYQKIKS